MDRKRDYYEDVRFFSSGAVVVWFALLLAFLAVFPLLFKNYSVYVANYIAINVIVVVGLNILVGYTGLISLGHAGFFAIGAFGTLIFMTKLSLPFLLALPTAALVAGFFGFLLGLPALRRGQGHLPPVYREHTQIECLYQRCRGHRGQAQVCDRPDPDR